MERLKLVKKVVMIALIIATILPLIVDLNYDLAHKPNATYELTFEHSARPYEKALNVYFFPIVLCLLFFPLGLAIAAVMIIVYIKKRASFWYVLWIIYLILVYFALPFTITGERFL